MNQTQRVYIKNRVKGILNDKISEARIKFTTPAKSITNQERIHLIRAGKVKMKPDKDLRAVGNYGLNVTTVFDFSKFETPGKLDQDALRKHTKKLQTKANEITDSVMIGDAEEALKMIRDFENLKI